MMKVAIVTGASRGIGKAIAQGLGEDGFNLALTARSQEGLARAKEEILAKNPNIDIQIYAFDVRDPKAVNMMVSDVMTRFGRVDLLFNNAGIYHDGTIDLSLDNFAEMIEVNLKAAFQMLKDVTPIMKAQKSGTIINLSSRSGKIAKAGSGGYAATKFGLVGLNEALYKELSPHGIKVTAICPGWVNTDMAQGSGIENSDMIMTADIVATVRWIESLSPSACVKDVLIESIAQTR
jgi:short-subunit dehydrogenase